MRDNHKANIYRHYADNYYQASCREQGLSRRGRIANRPPHATTALRYATFARRCANQYALVTSERLTLDDRDWLMEIRAHESRLSS